MAGKREKKCCLGIEKKEKKVGDWKKGKVYRSLSLHASLVGTTSHVAQIVSQSLKEEVF